jgi:hypothetical protein
MNFAIELKQICFFLTKILVQTLFHIKSEVYLQVQAFA